LDVGLGGRKSQPDCAHHDGQAEVHGYADAVRDDVAVGFNERAVDQG
jgi:hypothetical protein